MRWTSPQMWVETVGRTHTPNLAAEARRGVLASPNLSAPALAALLEDRSVVEGWPGVHVVRLLAAIGDPHTLPVLVDLLWDAPPDGPVVVEAEAAVAGFGTSALPLLLQAAAHAPWEVAMTLATCAAGTADPQVRQILEAILHEEPDLGAAALGVFGDRAALPPLFAALARCTVRGWDPLVGQDVVEIVDAIHHLGGDAGELGRRRLAEVRRARAPLSIRPPRRAVASPWGGVL